LEEGYNSGGRELVEEDVLRAHFYGFIAHLLAAPPVEATLARLCRLRADDTPLGRALGALSETARGVTPTAAADEFNALFIGLTEGELRPYASYYLTGFLYEKPLAALRSDLERLGARRADGVCEPEDHIASLCETMRGLIVGAFGAPADLQTQRRFFAAYLQPWTSRFFQDLRRARQAVLYRPVGAVGGAFMGVEREAFAMIG
jgi:TorA maturation chaperone TorD